MSVSPILRRFAFFAYSAILFALPFGFLASETGTYLGLGLFCLFAFYVRETSTRRLAKRLKLTPLFKEHSLGIYTPLQAYVKRLEIPVPKIFLIPSPGLNAGVFSLGNQKSLLFSEGLLEALSREELEAVTIRLLTELTSKEVQNRSWLTQFLLLLEGPTWMKHAGNKRIYSTVTLLKQLVFYPLSWLPIHLLWNSEANASKDAVSVGYTRKNRALSEAYRKMESRRERTPFLCAFAFHPLFLTSPFALDPIADFFMVNPSLYQRILRLEGRAPV